MRPARTIAIAAFFLSGAFLVLYSLQSRYLRFVDSDAGYYRQVADACDSVKGNSHARFLGGRERATACALPGAPP